MRLLNLLCAVLMGCQTNYDFEVQDASKPQAFRFVNRSATSHIKYSFSGKINGKARITVCLADLKHEKECTAESGTAHYFQSTFQEKHQSDFFQHTVVTFYYTPLTATAGTLKIKAVCD